MLIIYNNNYSALIPPKKKKGPAGASEGASAGATAEGPVVVDVNAKMLDLCKQMEDFQDLLLASSENQMDNTKLTQFMQTFEQTNSALKTFQQARKNKKVKEINLFSIGSAYAKNNVLAHAIILFNDTWCANEDIRTWCAIENTRKKKQKFEWIRDIVGNPKIWTISNHMYEDVNIPKKLDQDMEAWTNGDVCVAQLVQDMKDEVGRIPYPDADTDIKGYGCSPMEIQFKSKHITNQDVYNCIWFDNDIGNELVLYENYVSRSNKDDKKDYKEKFEFFSKDDYKMLTKIFQPLYYDGQTSPLVKLNLTDSKKNVFNMSRDYVLTFIHERFKSLWYWVEREKGKKDIFEMMHEKLLEDGESKQMLLNPHQLNLENENLLKIHTDLIKFWCFFLQKWFKILDKNSIQHTNQHLRNDYVYTEIEKDTEVQTEYKEYEIQLEKSLYLVHKNIDEMFSTVLMQTNNVMEQFRNISEADKDNMRSAFVQNGMDMANVILSYVFQNKVPVKAQIEKFSKEIHTYFQDKFYQTNQGTKFIYFESQPDTRQQNRNQDMWYSVNKFDLNGLNIKLTKDSTGKISFNGKILDEYLNDLFNRLFQQRSVAP